ncbi:MAG: hypothetical protein WBG02_07970, partial [Candidatus Acidiferrum sp.]
MPIAPDTYATTSYSYNSFGEVLTTTDPMGNAYDDKNLIEEVNSAGSVVARYTQGENIDEPLAMLRSGATSYY